VNACVGGHPARPAAESVFNSFIVLSGILATGIGARLPGGKANGPGRRDPRRIARLILVRVYQLDERGSELVKLAEVAMIAGETACLPEFARIIMDEAKLRTSRHRGARRSVDRFG
jgi:hypothetical protein